MARRGPPRHHAAGDPGEDVRLSSCIAGGPVAGTEVHRPNSLRSTVRFTMLAGDSKRGGVGDWGLAALVDSDGCRLLLPSWSSPTIRATRHSHMRMEERAVYRDWINSLRDVAARARIQMRIDRLVHGNPGTQRQLADGVTKIKIDFGPGYREYCTIRGTSLLLSLCGGDSSTQQRDIEKAIRLARNYEV